MEFVSDFFARQAAATDEARIPEWSGIRLRLAAAQAARRELLAAGLALSEHRGSFAAGAAIALADIAACKRVVNPDALETGKLDERRDGPCEDSDPKVAG